MHAIVMAERLKSRQFGNDGALVSCSVAVQVKWHKRRGEKGWALYFRTTLATINCHTLCVWAEKMSLHAKASNAFPMDEYVLRSFHFGIQWLLFSPTHTCSLCLPIRSAAQPRRLLCAHDSVQLILFGWLWVGPIKLSLGGLTDDTSSPPRPHLCADRLANECAATVQGYGCLCISNQFTIDSQCAVCPFPTQFIVALLSGRAFFAANPFISAYNPAERFSSHF